MKGFTLIEIIIYLTIVSLFLSFLFVSIFNFFNYRSYYFYFNELNKELVFLNKKFLFYFQSSNDFNITTSTLTTTIAISRNNDPNLVKIYLNNGVFYIERNNNLFQLSSSKFDFSSSTFEILTGNKKGIKINLIGKLREYLNQKTKLNIEFIYYLK